MRRERRGRPAYLQQQRLHEGHEAVLTTWSSCSCTLAYLLRRGRRGGAAPPLGDQGSRLNAPSGISGRGALHQVPHTHRTFRVSLTLQGGFERPAHPAPCQGRWETCWMRPRAAARVRSPAAQVPGPCSDGPCTPEATCHISSH